MKKAGSPTGLRKKNPEGLTLLETLLAALILSSSIIFIAPAFFRSGLSISSLTHRYEAELLMDNLISEKEIDLRENFEIDHRTLTGEEDSGRMIYSYELETRPEDPAGRLYLLTARVQWHDMKPNQVSKKAYILK